MELFRRLKSYRQGLMEIAYWERKFQEEGGHHNTWRRSHFEELFIKSVGDPILFEAIFFTTAPVVDIGCGPRGSLEWVGPGRVLIGVDPLVDIYRDGRYFVQEDSNMLYIKGTAENLPLPTGFAQVLLSYDVLGRVSDFEKASSEILRVLRPGGYFLGGLDIDAPATPGEPTSLDEKSIREHLLEKMEMVYETVAPNVEGKHGILYCCYRKGV